MYRRSVPLPGRLAIPGKQDDQGVHISLGEPLDLLSRQRIKIGEPNSRLLGNYAVRCVTFVSIN